MYRFFEANGTAYLVMAFEEGMSLAAILKQAGTLPESEILEFLDPLLDGVAEVHKAGFLHRDIKPANVVIRRDGTPSLIDFGAARLALGSKTESASKAIVSPGYAPFEQYTSTAEQGPYTDIYALGATLYCCVTGERPPEAPDRVAGQSMPSAVDRARGRYSDALLRAIDHALAVRAEDRAQTVTAWREELADEVAPDTGSSTTVPGRNVAPPREPPETQPPSAPKPRSRRRPLKLAALAIVALAGSAGAYEGIRYYIEVERVRAAERAERERIEEQQRREKAEREERERREAALRAPAENAALKGREMQRSAQAVLRLAVAARQHGFTAADCGRKAAERGRKREAGYYSGKLTDSSTYEGKLNARNLPDGCGVLIDTSGRRTEGNFSEGLTQGYVTIVANDGSRYEGNYKANKAHGHGILRYGNGDEESGEFREGKLHGPAVWVATSGARYEGDYVNGTWSGHGVLRESDGRIFEGQFAEGRLHGLAVLTATDGRKTHGRWEKGSYKGLE